MSSTVYAACPKLVTNYCHEITCIPPPGSNESKNTDGRSTELYSVSWYIENHIHVYDNAMLV